MEVERIGHRLAVFQNLKGAPLGDASGRVREAHVDMGYGVHDCEGAVTVHIDKRRRGRTSRRLWRWMKRRAAVEPSIGHLKTEHR